MDEELKLIAYCVNRFMAMPLVPAPSERDWMNATDKRYANRCLPLLLANQLGWFLLSSHSIQVVWSGGDSPASLRIRLLSGDEPCPAVSHFGYGILTWHVPYVFRTPAAYNLLVRGPANWPKDGISPLEGLVETDWADATFTMNWKITRPRHPIIFDVGEPIAMILPQQRGELEAFQPEICDLESEPRIQGSYEQWAKDRSEFNAELHQPESQAQKQGWQKHYFRGVNLDSESFEHHQTKLKLKSFIE